nr:hypothetical protein [uncultured Butyrivibrio sp.]
MATNRADLINQLAASMGAGAYASTKYQDSRFDADTGTLYCNGVRISQSVAEQAIKHFTLLKNKCENDSPEAQQMIKIYQCAIESIKMMQNPKVKAVIRAEALNDDSFLK